MSPAMWLLALAGLAWGQDADVPPVAEEAVETAEDAAQEAVETAEDAVETAEDAVETAEDAVETAEEAAADVAETLPAAAAAEPVAEADPEAAKAAACAVWAKPFDPSSRLCIPLGSSGASFETEGQHRLIFESWPGFDADARGGRVEAGSALDHRFRVAAGFGYKTLKIATEWDLWTGQLAGSSWGFDAGNDGRRQWQKPATTREAFVPRRASLSAVVPDPGGSRVPLMIIEGGLMPATHWGLGLLANGGDRDTLFGRVDGGDRMLRFRFTTAPATMGGQRLPLFFTFAFDRVVEDDTARWRDGQVAYHVIGSMLWRGPKGAEAGLFFTHRTQTEPGDAPRPTFANVVDLFGKLPIDPGGGFGLELSAEGVLIVGKTQRLLTYGDLEDTRIGSGALVGNLEVSWPRDIGALHLGGGWTSAGGDPDSGGLKDFTVDRNVNVGMVLFDHLQAGIEEATWSLINDPTLSGGPPDGAEASLTEGSIRRAAWINPVFTFAPLPWLDARVGYVAAWSTGPIAQPFYTVRGGGQPRNHLDEATAGSFLGHEFDWGVGVGVGPRTANWMFRPKLLVEGGVALPSQNMGGGVLNMVRLTGRVDW